MAIRKIVEMGKDDILRKHARRVERFDRRLGVLLSDMADTMYEADGVGLAAPQSRQSGGNHGNSEDR